MPRTTSRQKPERSAADTRSTKAAARPDAESAWKGFRRTKSAASRNTLVERYMPLVRAISARLSSELPNSVDADDLVSAGIFGLMDAIERYDPSLGTRFETYCVVRIRGAMLDELRHLNWVPRNHTTRAAKVGAAIDLLRGELGRAPTPDEIAHKAGLCIGDVHRAPKTAHTHYSLTSDAPGSEDGATVRHIDIIEDRQNSDPAALLQQKERRAILGDEVRKLPRAERLLVMLYYFDQLTMKQIGEVLDVTESRVCQMHTGILARLQRRLSELDEAEPVRA